jgi:hypothetical protein
METLKFLFQLICVVAVCVTGWWAIAGGVTIPWLLADWVLPAWVLGCMISSFWFIGRAEENDVEAGLIAACTMLFGFLTFVTVGWLIAKVFYLSNMFLLLWTALAFVGGGPTGDVIIIIIPK